MKRTLRLSGYYDSGSPRGRAFLDVSIPGYGESFQFQYPKVGATLRYAFPVGAYIEIRYIRYLWWPIGSNDDLFGVTADFSQTRHVFHRSSHARLQVCSGQRA